MSEQMAEQNEAIAFLADPATHGGAPVERVDTHISHLFLAGDRAWKLKRALTLPFLDFSTLAAREAACRRELEVNAASGDLYLGVRPIRRDAEGRLRLGGEAGEIVDWVVEMRRFDRAQELDRLLEAGRLDRRAVERFADAIAGRHRAAEIRRVGDGAARLAATAAKLAAALAAPDWGRAITAELARLGPLLDARARHGFVRRCHGDLHLGNAVMLDGAPTPFDAIEFNEEMATIDIAYDVAFAVMDLLSRGAPDLSNALIGRYFGALRDYRGLALAPAAISIRAAVRAMAAEMRGDAPAAARRRALMAEALGARPAPRLVAVGGLSGSGKSTLARGLAPGLGPLFGAVVISSDVVRKRMLGRAPEERLPPAAYAPDVSARVYLRMAVDARRALLAGCSVVLDAVHGAPEDQKAAARIACSLGLRFDGLWLDAPRAERIARVEARRGDPSDADVRIAAAQTECGVLAAGWRSVAAGADPASALAAARAALGL